MDSDTLLDYALFQLSPRRSRYELFASRNGKAEKIASGFVKPFVEHLKVVEEQASKAAKSIKLDIGRSSNDRTWFNKGTVERFVRFVSTPEILELISAFEAEISQLEGAKRIYSQGARDPFSDSLGENEITNGESVDMTKKKLLKAIELRLVSIKHDLTVACSRASSSGFTYDNVSELLHFAHYFGAKRLREACSNFISLCQRYPEFVNLRHLPQSKPLPQKSIDDNIVLSSSSSDMSIDDFEDETGISGKPTDDGLHLQKPTCPQLEQKNAAKLLGTNQLSKPIQQQFAAIAGTAVDDPIPETLITESSQQDSGGDPRRLSVQDRISMFESKQKEQTLCSKNINPNVGIKGVIAGKRDLRRLPSDVSDKSVLRRWSGASDMSMDIRSTSCSSFNEKKHGWSDYGTPSANLQLQSFCQSGEMVAELKNPGSEQSQLGPKENIACIQHAYFEALKDRDLSKVKGNKTPVTQSQADFPMEQRKHRATSVSVSGMELSELSDQDTSQAQQNGISGLTDRTGLKFHTNCQSESTTMQLDYVHAKDHVVLTTTLKDVSAAAEKYQLKKEKVFRFPIREVLSDAGMKVQSLFSTQFPPFTRNSDDLQVKIKGPLPIQVGSITSLISLETQSQGQEQSCSKIMKAGGRKSVASEKPSRTILGHPGRNLDNPSDSMKFEGESIHSKRCDLPVSSARAAKLSMELLESSLEQIIRPPKGGNQELHDELKMKANELEKVYAEHKLKFRKEQTSNFQGKHPDVYKDDMLKTSQSELDFDASMVSNILDNKGYGSNLCQRFNKTSQSELDFDTSMVSNILDNKGYGSNLSQRFNNKTNNLRGKFYDKYMRKRNAKILEEWNSSRSQKEIKMKAMRDELEQIVGKFVRPDQICKT